MTLPGQAGPDSHIQAVARQHRGEWWAEALLQLLGRLYWNIFIEIIWQPRTRDEKLLGWADYTSAAIGPFRTETEARKFAVELCKRHKGSGTKPKNYPKWRFVHHVAPAIADGWSVD